MDRSTDQRTRVAFIGFGEAAQAFVQGWRADSLPVSIRAYDRLFDSPEQGAPKRTDCCTLQVIPATSSMEAVEGADLVISAVTADQSLNAAEQALGALQPGQFYLDINSVSPGKKRRAAEIVEATGANYIDVAVMAPVHPRLHRTPLLVSAPRAERARGLLDCLALSYRIVGEGIGQASTTKMLRSILIKGMESLLTECVTAANKVGIGDEILASAAKTLGIDDPHGLADYMMERVVVHGRRRAAEMREVADTLEELGVSHFMASATARHQQLIADLEIKGQFDVVPEDRHALAEAMAISQSRELVHRE